MNLKGLIYIKNPDDYSQAVRHKKSRKRLAISYAHRGGKRSPTHSLPSGATAFHFSEIAES